MGKKEDRGWCTVEHEDRTGDVLAGVGLKELILRWHHQI